MYSIENNFRTGIIKIDVDKIENKKKRAEMKEELLKIIDIDETDELIDIPQISVDQSTHEKSKSTLNVEQQEIFTKTIQTVRHQAGLTCTNEIQPCTYCASKTIDPMRIFVTGEGKK